MTSRVEREGKWEVIQKWSNIHDVRHIGPSDVRHGNCKTYILFIFGGVDTNFGSCALVHFALL